MVARERTVARVLLLTRGDDRIKVTIFSDGYCRQETQGSISSINHGSADEMVTGIARMIGGKTEWETGKGHEKLPTITTDNLKIIKR